MKTHVAVFSMNIIQFFNEFMWSKNGFSFCNTVTLAQEIKIYLKMALPLWPFTKEASQIIGLNQKGRKSIQSM